MRNVRKKRLHVSAIQALLNSEGGEVKLLFTGTVKEIGQGPKSTMVLKEEIKKSFIRKIEQILVSTAGVHITSSNVDSKRDPIKDRVLIEVKSANVLIMSNTNIYLPTAEQVNVIYTADPEQQTIHEILNRQNVENWIELGSHVKLFLQYRHSGLHESKVAEFKFPKAASAKRTTLADRITGKCNRFSCYVSAFANYRGGHIYCGITDDGFVGGELISSEREIRNKVEKAINKMIWPEQIGQPKRGIHWDIFFEPVVDENLKPIKPSTFVIVVYIAPCLGGVFTDVPECYEMVQGKVEKMSFDTWKKRLLFHSHKIPSKLQRITKGLTRIQVICTMVNEILTQRMNNGKSIAILVKKLTEEKLPGLIEVQLVILSKQVMLCYRSCCFEKAKEFLGEYDDLLKKLKKRTEFKIFDAIRAYLEVAIHRASGDMNAQRCVNALADALKNAKKIAPGLVTAGIYLLAATVTSIVPPKNEDGRDKSISPDGFLIRALKDLQYVQESPILRMDMEQKVHITLALFYLGCNTSNKVVTKKHVDSKSLEKAKSSLATVNKSICEGNPMNRYREVQLNLVQSILFYRYSQIQPERESKEVSLLQEAFNFSKKAEQVACRYRFEEMSEWARACMALYTEGLVRTNLKTSPRARANSSQNLMLYGQDAISTDDERLANSISYC